MVEPLDKPKHCGLNLVSFRVSSTVVAIVTALRFS